MAAFLYAATFDGYIISFHVLRAEPGAYLSPSVHLRPEIAPPFICSDLEYKGIVADKNNN